LALVALPRPAAADERGGSAADFAAEIAAQTAAPRSDLVPQWARPSLAKAEACHSTTPCGAAYPSCAGWSGYTDCGDPQCGIYRWCGDCGDPFGCWDLATRQRRERFRVCFDQFGNSCTEWQNTLVLVACGC
jgi:hypothetical protein